MKVRHFTAIKIYNEHTCWSTVESSSIRNHGHNSLPLYFKCRTVFIKFLRLANFSLAILTISTYSYQAKMTTDQTVTMEYMHYLLQIISKQLKGNKYIQVIKYIVFVR